jgi:hypothetical protein
MSTPKKAAAAEKTEVKTEDAATNGKKRSREEDAAADGGEVKKVKADEEKA